MRNGLVSGLIRAEIGDLGNTAQMVVDDIFIS